MISSGSVTIKLDPNQTFAMGVARPAHSRNVLLLRAEGDAGASRAFHDEGVTSECGRDGPDAVGFFMELSGGSDSCGLAG